MSDSKQIKVVLGTNIKRTSVLINPAISANDNPTTGEEAKNVISSGSSSDEVLSKIYGKNR